VRRGVIGKVRGRAEWIPARVGHGSRVAVGACYGQMPLVACRFACASTSSSRGFPSQ
jgi:hypothetical protein